VSDERAFLQAILEHPGDDGRKLVYADWREERGDPRGEYLRLTVQVRRGRVVTPEQRQRHQELAAELTSLRTQEAEAWRTDRGNSPENRERWRQIRAVEGQLAALSGQFRQEVPARLQALAAACDPTWLAVVSDPVIEGCGKGAGPGWGLRFEVVCDRTLADLEAAQDSTVRHCAGCGKNVHFCDNLADAREHAREGRCIAVDLGIIRREGDLNRGGMFLRTRCPRPGWMPGSSRRRNHGPNGGNRATRGRGVPKRTRRGTLSASDCRLWPGRPDIRAPSRGPPRTPWRPTSSPPPRRLGPGRAGRTGGAGRNRPQAEGGGQVAEGEEVVGVVAEVGLDESGRSWRGPPGDDTVVKGAVRIGERSL
jgi:uncharacterized protein (TIGR02996 family)